jgi:hypothetical protein
MFRKSTIMALAALASIGTLAFSSTNASAFRAVGGSAVGGASAIHGGGSGGFHGGIAFRGGGLRPGGGIRPIFNGGIRPIFNGGIHHPNGGFGFHRFVYRPHWHHHHCWRWGWRWCGFAQPYWIAPTVVTGGVAASYATTAPTYNRCTCLTKEYTQEGAVVFKDVCTNEMAMNPPTLGPSASDTQQPAPQGYAQQPMQPQQGYLQPPQMQQNQPYPQYR